MALSEPLALPQGREPANGQMIAFGNDETGVVPEFYNRQVKDANASLAAGRPIFIDIPYVRIVVPGDRNMTSEQKVTDAHRERFPKAWARFQAGQAQAPTGTPIEQVPWLTPREVAELKALNVMSLEQMAELSDGMCSKANGLMLYRDKARTYVKAAEDSALAMRQDQTIRDQNAKIADQAGALARLEATVAKLTTLVEGAGAGAALRGIMAPPGPSEG